MERVTFKITPARIVRYKGESYSLVSFDTSRAEFTDSSGKRGIRFDEDDVYCTLIDAMTRKTVRVHLQDPDMEF